jgi:hypothetical protein
MSDEGSRIILSTTGDGKALRKNRITGCDA